MPPRPPRPVAPSRPDFATTAVRAVQRWFTVGNVPVKIGMLVLFAGVAALLKYGADVEVLAPPSLVDLVAGEIRRMAARLPPAANVRDDETAVEAGTSPLPQPSPRDAGRGSKTSDARS